MGIMVRPPSVTGSLTEIKGVTQILPCFNKFTGVSSNVATLQLELETVYTPVKRVELNKYGLSPVVL